MSGPKKIAIVSPSMFNYELKGNNAETPGPEATTNIDAKHDQYIFMEPYDVVYVVQPDKRLRTGYPEGKVEFVDSVTDACKIIQKEHTNQDNHIHLYSGTGKDFVELRDAIIPPLPEAKTPVEEQIKSGKQTNKHFKVDRSATPSESKLVLKQKQENIHAFYVRPEKHEKVEGQKTQNIEQKIGQQHHQSVAFKWAYSEVDLMSEKLFDGAFNPMLKSQKKQNNRVAAVEADVFKKPGGDQQVHFASVAQVLSFNNMISGPLDLEKIREERVSEQEKRKEEKRKAAAALVEQNRKNKPKKADTTPAPDEGTTPVDSTHSTPAASPTATPASTQGKRGSQVGGGDVQTGEPAPAPVPAPTGNDNPAPVIPQGAKPKMVKIDEVIQAIQDKRINRSGGFLSKFRNFFQSGVRGHKKAVTEAFIAELEAIKRQPGDPTKAFRQEPGQTLAEVLGTTEIAADKLDEMLEKFRIAQAHVEVKRNAKSVEEAKKLLKGEKLTVAKMGKGIFNKSDVDEMSQGKFKGLLSEKQYQALDMGGGVKSDWDKLSHKQRAGIIKEDARAFLLQKKFVDETRDPKAQTNAGQDYLTKRDDVGNKKKPPKKGK